MNGLSEAGDIHGHTSLWLQTILLPRTAYYCTMGYNVQNHNVDKHQIHFPTQVLVLSIHTAE